MPEFANVEALMKRCQIGVGGRQALDDAHDIMAECYGTLGALMINVREMRGQIAEQKRMIETYMSDIMRDRSEIERLRSTAEYAAKRLECARVWSGSEWSYLPLHPIAYRSALERLRDVLLD